MKELSPLIQAAVEDTIEDIKSNEALMEQIVNDNRNRALFKDAKIEYATKNYQIAWKRLNTLMGFLFE